MHVNFHLGVRRVVDVCAVLPPMLVPALMSSELKKKLLYLKSIDFFSTLEIQRGIEKESLRVDKDGAISEKTHPIGLGSSLTNPYITTDFASKN